MSISENVTATLRAQDHGHPPVVICFEPRSPDGVPRICGGVLLQRSTQRKEDSDSRV